MKYNIYQADLNKNNLYIQYTCTCYNTEVTGVSDNCKCGLISMEKSDVFTADFREF